MNRSATEARNFRTFLLMSELERDGITSRIGQARRDAGLTQEEMADLLGVIPRTIQNYESKRVPWRHLKEIATITGKPQEWFLRGDEDDGEDPAVQAVRAVEALDSKIDVDVTPRLDGIERELRELRRELSPGRSDQSRDE